MPRDTHLRTKWCSLCQRPPNQSPLQSPTSHPRCPTGQTRTYHQQPPIIPPRQAPSQSRLFLLRIQEPRQSQITPSPPRKEVSLPSIIESEETKDTILSLADQAGNLGTVDLAEGLKMEKLVPVPIGFDDEDDEESASVTLIPDDRWIAIRTDEVPDHYRHQSSNALDFLELKTLRFYKKKLSEPGGLENVAFQLALLPGWKLVVKAASIAGTKSQRLSWVLDALRFHLRSKKIDPNKLIGVADPGKASFGEFIVFMEPDALPAFDNIRSFFDQKSGVLVMVREWPKGLNRLQSFAAKGLWEQGDNKSWEERCESFRKQTAPAMEKLQMRINRFTKLDALENTTQVTLEFVGDRPLIILPENLPDFFYLNKRREQRQLTWKWLPVCSICSSEQHRTVLCPWKDHSFVGGRKYNGRAVESLAPGEAPKPPRPKKEEVLSSAKLSPFKVRGPTTAMEPEKIVVDPESA